MALDDGGGRAGRFWADVIAALQEAGLTAAKAFGELRATVHYGRVTKVHFGLDKKTGGADAEAAGFTLPLYGAERLQESFQACVEELVAGSTFQFGDIAVQFVGGDPTLLVVTARIRPDEGGPLNDMLDKPPG